MRTETEERFLREIVGRLPLERIADLHLFPSFRHGQMETGCAVIAAVMEPEATEEDAEAAARAAHNRHTVFTARYRLTIKGADRGRWEFDLVEEADAPLLTVDAVVRGVQERAGEETEPVRLTADDVRASLPELQCTTTG
jgi:hypothetical protein